MVMKILLIPWVLTYPIYVVGCNFKDAELITHNSVRYLFWPPQSTCFLKKQLIYLDFNSSN